MDAAKVPAGSVDKLNCVMAVPPDPISIVACAPKFPAAFALVI
jgi:hypothetical protein